MDTPDHHQLAKLLFVEAQQPRSNMKAILDLAEDRLTAERAIAVAHNSLSKQGHTDAIKTRNTHTTQEESADSSRSDVTGAIFYFHRYKITYDYRVLKLWEDV